MGSLLPGRTGLRDNGRAKGRARRAGAQSGRAGAVGPVWRAAWRHDFTPAALVDRLASLDDSVRARPRRALLAARALPELGRRLVVDDFQPLERPHELLAVGAVIEPQALERQPLERGKVPGRDVADAQLLEA